LPGVIDVVHGDTFDHETRRLPVAAGGTIE
jgi:hypothetical protein